MMDVEAFIDMAPGDRIQARLPYRIRIY